MGGENRMNDGELSLAVIGELELTRRKLIAALGNAHDRVQELEEEVEQLKAQLQGESE